MTYIADITAKAIVDDVMNGHPATIAVFLRHRMACVGCLMGPFHTVADAAAEYEIAPEELVAELRDSVVQTQTGVVVKGGRLHSC